MRTEAHAAAAVNTDMDIAFPVGCNGLDRAGSDTFTATDAESPLEKHAAAVTGHKGPCRTGCGAGRIWAGKAVAGDKSGRQATRTLDSDTGMLPGDLTVNQTGTGQGTGMATNAAVHVRGRQDIH